MIIIIFMLFLILALQTIKIFIKSFVLNKNKVDLFLELIILLLAFICIFKCKELSIQTLLIILIICIIYEILSYIYIYFTFIKNKKLSQLGIKNVIDNSLNGLLVLKNGKKVLINNKMYKILNKINIKDDYINKIIKNSIEHINNDYILKVDDEYYLFNLNDNEIIAFNITEEYKLKKEIEEQNNKIESINNELINSIENIEILEKEENLLKIKNKYHDTLGGNLSILHQYLNNQDNNNFEEIKFMIRKMLIDEYDGDDPYINLNNLIKMHKISGTNINVIGTLPKNKEHAKVFYEIIREAVTNAIKHASSNNVKIEIKETLEKTTMNITNNGRKSREFITENDGIKGMKRKVKDINGLIYIETSPKFSIKVIVNNY